MHYHWQDPDSLLKDLEFYKPHKKEEAILFAPLNIDPALLQNATGSFRQHGMTAEPDQQDGSYVLRVKNFTSPAAVLKILEEKHLVHGQPAITKTKYDKKKPFKINTVRLAGAIHFCTDVTLTTAGFLRGSKEGAGDMRAGIQWGAVGALLALMGAKNPDKQTGYVYKDLQQQFKDLGIELSPEDAATLKALSEKDGLLPKVERLVRENPIIINNVVTASGGISLMQAGYAQKFPLSEKRNFYKVIAGGLTAVGQLAGILIDPKKVEIPKELREAAAKPPAEKEKPGLIEGRIAYYQEKPLRITGHMSMASNLFRLISGVTEIKRNNQFLETQYPAKVNACNTAIEALGTDRTNKDLLHGILQGKGKVFTDYAKGKTTPVIAGTDKTFFELEEQAKKLQGEYVRIEKVMRSAKLETSANIFKFIANCIYGMSSTNIDADLKGLGLLDEIGNTIAHFIAGQPGEKRTELVYNLSAMLSEQKGVSATPKELAGIISSKLAAIGHNPWEKNSSVPTTHLQTVAQHAPLEASSRLQKA